MLFEKCSPLLIKGNAIGLKSVCNLFALGKIPADIQRLAYKNLSLRELAPPLAKQIQPHY